MKLRMSHLVVVAALAAFRPCGVMAGMGTRISHGTTTFRDHFVHRPTRLCNDGREALAEVEVGGQVFREVKPGEQIVVYLPGGPHRVTVSGNGADTDAHRRWEVEGEAGSVIALSAD